jgi:hypothetical protein
VHPEPPFTQRSRRMPSWDEILVRQRPERSLTLGGGGRVALRTFRITNERGATSVDIHLTHPTIGEVQGRATTRGSSRERAAAQAVVAALETLAPPDTHLECETVDVRPRSVLVEIAVASGDGHELLVGAAAIPLEDPLLAAAKATLAAVNRRVQTWPA